MTNGGGDGEGSSLKQKIQQMNTITFPLQATVM